MAIQPPYSSGQQPIDLTLLDNLKQWLGITGKNISAITQANPGKVTTIGAHNLITGMTVPIDQVVGMTQVNNVYFQITVVDSTNFTIGADTTGYTAYAGGGYVGTDDALLGRIVSSASQFIQSWLNRQIAARPYVEVRNGYGQDLMSLQQYPIQSVASVTIDGVAIPARPPLAATVWQGTPGGYVADNDTVYLDGYCFNRGRQNVTISYVGGYMVSAEAQTIPAGAPYVLYSQAYWVASDQGVVYASNGTALTKVTGAPAAGQYALSGSTYTFAAADAGKGVLISYGYIPIDVEQAVIELIGDYFTARTRIGMASKSIEGQSVSFTNTMTERVASILNQYRKVTPIQ